MQIWHGLLLFIVLVAFAGTACWFVRTEQVNRVDQELRRRLAMIVTGGGPGPRGNPLDRPPGPRGGGGPGARGEGAGGGGPGAGPGFRVPQGQRGLFEETERGSYYYIIWSPEGDIANRSATAPENVPPPDASLAPERPPRMRLRGGEPLPEERGRFGEVRVRGNYRERVAVGQGGERAVVGHAMTPENAELRRLALLFTGAGGGVLLLGLLVGGWLSGRAIRPVADISAAAKKIADGNLSERINMADTESELGELARVLNETFARLDASFARQARFTADASHELRTPAFVILSEAQSALKRERTAAEYREGFEVCQRAAQQMRQLIESLLILARQDAGEASVRREPCQLDVIAGEVVDLLRPLAAERNVTVHADLRSAPLSADVQQLRQLLTNLVGNAIEYNRPAGDVRVAVTAADETVVLTVSDTGIGIAPEDLPHIFERFYRADKSRSTSDGHTGLGLSICEVIVKAHAGTIEVESKPGIGTQFVVCLPR